MIQRGDCFPNFSYDSYDGRRKTFYEETAGGPAALFFLRYMGCTKCQMDVHDLLCAEEEIRQQGIRVFIVFQSPAETVNSTLEDFPYEIICDPEQKLYAQFGVKAAETKEEFLDFEHFAAAHEAFRARKAELGLEHGAYEGNELQKPALFLLDRDRKVLLAHYADSLMDMPDTAAWLAYFQ